MFFYIIHVFLLYILLKINHGFDVRPYNDLIRFYNDIIVNINFPAAAGLLLLMILLIRDSNLKMFC